MDLACNVSKGYNPPNRKLISKDPLVVIHDQNTKIKLTHIKKEADLFGLLFLVDGTTISRTPLLNILVSGNTLPVAVLELVGCQGNLPGGGKNNGSFICCRFIDHMRVIDPDKSLTDVDMFDGAANVQLSGELLKIYCPKLTVVHVVEHTLSLFLIMFQKSQL